MVSVFFDYVLYLHTSDFFGMVLVSKVFDGTGFGGWSRVMKIVFSVKNKIFLVDGIYI